MSMPEHWIPITLVNIIKMDEVHKYAEAYARKYAEKVEADLARVREQGDAVDRAFVALGRKHNEAEAELAALRAAALHLADVVGSGNKETPEFDAALAVLLDKEPT